MTAAPEPTPQLPAGDPRRRRWTILLVLLAIIVVAGVALRALDDRGADSGDDRADLSTDRIEQADDELTRESDDGDDDPAGDDATSTETPFEPSATPVDTPLEIEVGQVPAVDGALADVVYGLGPISLGSAATLPKVTAALGAPDSTGASATDPAVCDATWVAHGLEAGFYFGHPPSHDASCTKGPIAVALMTGERWRVKPDGTVATRELRVGDPEAAITAAVRDARREPLSPGLAALTGAAEGWLLGEGSYGGDPFPTLYAIVVDGSIASFLYVSGAD